MASALAGDFLKTLGREVALLVIKHQRFKEYHQRNTDNAMENLRFYYSKNPELGLGQYKMEAVVRLLKMGRQVVQHNFSMPLIDTVAATLLQMNFNPSYIPTNFPITKLTEAINSTVKSDREMMNWDDPIFDFALDGLLHQGWIKMGVSDKWHKIGNISFSHVPMGTVLPDPQWQTRSSRDIKDLIEEGYRSAEEIAQTYENRHDAIMEAARRDTSDGKKYGGNRGVMGMANYDATEWGSLYQVIENYYIKEVKKKFTCLVQPDRHVRIPDNVQGKDIGQWLDAHFPDWQPDDVYEDVETTPICYKRTACPTLLKDEFLEGTEEGKPTIIQTGALPHHAFSASNLNGDPRGLIESIKDAQTYFNYWSGLMTFKIQTEGGGGGQFVARDMFINDQEFLKYCHYRNNPAENFEIKTNYMAENRMPAKPVYTSQINPDLYKNIEFIINTVVPHISKVTPARVGTAEGSNESGYLFRQKKLQSELQTYTITYAWRRAWNDIYESHLMESANIYGHEGVPRMFYYNKGRDSIKINSLETDETGAPKRDENGNFAIINDFSKLKEIRHAVIIDEKPESPSDQAENLMLYADLVKSWAQFPQKASSVTFLLSKMTEYIPGIKEKDLIMLDNIGKKEQEFDFEKLLTNIANQKIQRIQADRQLWMMEQIQQGQTPQQGPGASAPPGPGGGAPPPPSPGKPPESLPIAAPKQAAPSTITQPAPAGPGGI